MQTQNPRSLQEISHPSGVFTLYFYREANYQGSGRFHFLTIDGKKIGLLETDNYYRIDLWPGQYLLSVYLPVENFLGHISPPAQTSQQLTIRTATVPSSGIYKYKDGKGIYSVDPKVEGGIDALTTHRVLSKSLSARDTAQVKTLYDAHYDGPAMLGKAHGMGMLTWDDGSIFVGRFDFGNATNEGKFFTPGKPAYMGPKSKGRPAGPGVWITLDGHILFAGYFLDESPHGPGLRTGPGGPEFCEYDKGKDITPTLRERVIEAIKKEDERIADQTLADDLSPEKDNSENGPLDMAIEDQNSKTAALVTPEVAPPTKIAERLQEKQDPQPATVKKQTQVDTIPTKPSPYLRILAKQKELELKTRNQIKERQDWCKEEFLLGRRLCVCAPFADDFENWNSCDDR